MSDVFDVLVLGGGVAGLSTALGLRDAGLRILVAEAEPVLGGRARSWRDPSSDDPVGLGPHAIGEHDLNFLRLLEVCGTLDQLAWQPRQVLRTVFDEDHKIDLLRSHLPPPLALSSSLAWDPQLHLDDLISGWKATRVALGLDLDDVLLLDEHDGRAVLDALEVRPALERRYWEQLSMSGLHQALDRCSAGTLLRLHAQHAGHAAPRMGLPRGGLGDLFVPAARDTLEADGHSVWTEARAEALVIDGGKVCGAAFADGRVAHARHVVSTVPPRELRLILPAELRTLPAFAALESLEGVPYVSVYLWLDRRVTSLLAWSRTYSADDLNSDFYDLSNLMHPHRRGSLIASNMIDAQRAIHMVDEELIAHTMRELIENLPGAAHAVVRHARVHRTPQAMVAPRPGFEACRPGPRSPLPGLWLAGDYTATGLPCSLESAARSGWRAAELIGASVGQARTLVVEPPPAGRVARAVAARSRARPWPPRLERLVGLR